ncbi:beta-D-glucosidase [Haloferax volcanii DS2]|uniref:Beta-D-glucosidase n=1 Tax=Haloferax volcanii (strain ATCC 29605 / DSM 3757 / JCM 8879 / NBRC 14742 / NCIMB 2012 / VKM B-1768 / DS2) TaxID=309800 RepID=A0A384KNR0_HALVD|nr:beta-D-glucosidase [Haloferax volcanii DS2]
MWDIRWSVSSPPRWAVDRHDTEPLFPFGHGLSYATIEYGDVTVSERETGDGFEVAVDLRNASDRTGTEVVQVFRIGGNAGPRRSRRNQRRKTRRRWPVRTGRDGRLRERRPNGGPEAPRQVRSFVTPEMSETLTGFGSIYYPESELGKEVR